MPNVDKEKWPAGSQRDLAENKSMALFVPSGHYYSPIVDAAALAKTDHMDCVNRNSLLGVELNEHAMMAVFDRLKQHFPAIEFPEVKTESHRYYYQNDFYTYGDAIILSAMIRGFCPPGIIKVGPGFSSAALLDTLDAIGATQTPCTFIEPYPQRLRTLLRPHDQQRATIIRSGIQAVPLATFKSLEPGSLLFLDTTHVSKTGSDVNHEIFQILPRLKSGVIVHFHDVFHQFEYPTSWIFQDNRSWNEIYLLRAFLMYNNKFEILFFNQFISQRRPEILRVASEKAARNAGGETVG